MRSTALLILAVILSACQSVPTDQASHLPQQTQSLQQQQESTFDWEAYALQAQTLDAFTIALNNIIWQKNDSAFARILFLPDDRSSATASVETSGRANLKKANGLKDAFEYFTRTTAKVCPDLDHGDWSLVNVTAKNVDESEVTYRIENDDAYYWCRLTILKHDGRFRITELYDPVNILSYSDLVNGFYVLSTNPKVDLTPSRSKNSGFYRQYDTGLRMFDRYLHNAEVDISLPLIRVLRLQLMEQEKDMALVKKTRGYFIHDYGETALFSVRQLILNAQLNADKELLLRNLKAAEKATRDNSTLRSQVAMYLIGTEQQGFIEQLLNSAILADPTNDNLYLVYLEYYLQEQRYQEAVDTLRVLQHNFSYQFQRRHFTDDELYAGLVASSEFNAWLPVN